MNKAEIIGHIQAHEAELRRLGLQSLSLFGSVARGKAEPESDIDLLYEFAEGQASLDHLLDLQQMLEMLLGRSVDLVSSKYLSKHLRPYIEDEVETIL